MTMGSNHSLKEFILLGLSDKAELQIPLFVVLLLIYTGILVRNFGMEALIKGTPQLHTPMYFFLRYFSFVDVCYSTIITPKMLVSFLSESKSISFTGCVAQFYSFAVFGTADCYLLAVMAYDRYVAICKPLLYMGIVSKGACTQLVSASYIIGILCTMIYTGCTFGGTFCGSNTINHFFCNTTLLLKLSCSDTQRSEMMIFALGTINGVGTAGITFFYILAAVLRIHSAQGRSKAFNMCASHLTVVSLFYGTGFFMYLEPSSSHTGLDKVASVFYTVVTPMLNPLIYSLKNREVKDALKRMTGRRIGFHISPSIS